VAAQRGRKQHAAAEPAAEQEGTVLRWPAAWVLDSVVLEEDIEHGQQIDELVVETAGENGRPAEVARVHAVGFRRIVPLPPEPVTALRVRVLQQRGPVRVQQQRGPVRLLPIRGIAADFSSIRGSGHGGCGLRQHPSVPAADAARTGCRNAQKLPEPTRRARCRGRTPQPRGAPSAAAAPNLRT
jgi:hypothetical protein